jgi:hypothetical protein
MSKVQQQRAHPLVEIEKVDIVCTIRETGCCNSLACPWISFEQAS